LDKEIGLLNGENLVNYLNIEIKKNNILLKVIPKNHIFRRMVVKKRLRLLHKKKNSMGK